MMLIRIFVYIKEGEIYGSQYDKAFKDWRMFSV